MATDALTLTDIHTYYGESYVLQGISFRLQAGTVLALLGRNGAGKSTCISSIMGLLTPRRGEVRLFGTSLAGLKPESISRLGIGLVPQGRRLFPSLTVKENLSIARRREKLVDKPWTMARIFSVFPRLRERQNQLAGSMSGGEQQMLAIGRALMGNPRVILMDEPSEGLAPLIVAEVARTIELLKNEGQSIVLVEQNSKLATKLADQVVILNTGKCVFDGTIAEVNANPAGPGPEPRGLQRRGAGRVMANAVGLTVNGAPQSTDLPPDTPLVSLLRQDLGLKGTRVGCNEGRCGACTVLVDGRPTQSCTTPLWSVANRAVTTIEALSRDGVPGRIQQAFLHEQAAQCAYCINGIIMSLHGLLSRAPPADRAEILDVLEERHLCRCGAHLRILRAIDGLLATNGAS